MSPAGAMLASAGVLLAGVVAPAPVAAAMPPGPNRTGEVVCPCGFYVCVPRPRRLVLVKRCGLGVSPARATPYW